MTEVSPETASGLPPTGPTVTRSNRSAKPSAHLLMVHGVGRILTAATVPILGLPSILLRNYTRTFVATFTRFFEDIATFALDKNGEQLISAHLDRVGRDVKPLARSPGAFIRLVVAAVSFVPSLVAIAIPPMFAWRLSARSPDLYFGIGTTVTIVLVGSFLYVIACAGHQLIATWRRCCGRCRSLGERWRHPPAGMPHAPIRHGPDDGPQLFAHLRERHDGSPYIS